MEKLKFKGKKGQWSHGLIAEKGRYPAYELSLNTKGAESFIVVFCDNIKPNEEELANAKLIAAAPELLEALEKIDEYINIMNTKEVKDICRSAIEKALK